MKVYVPIFLLILLVVGTAGCTFQDFNFFDSNATKNYTGYGVTFNYPGNWMVISENATGIRTISVSKKANSTFSPTQVTIQPMSDQGMSEEAVISLYRNMQTPGWTKISNNTLTIDGVTAYESVYRVNDTQNFGELMRMHQIVFVKNNTVYVILLQAPDREFDSEKPVFDMVLNSFKVIQ
jgi:hypothetical protein